MPKKIEIDEFKLLKLFNENQYKHPSIIDNLAKNFHVSRTVVLRRLKQLGIDTSKQAFTPSLRGDGVMKMIKMFKEGKTSKQLAKIFKCGASNISRILTKNDLNHKLIYDYDKNFFQEIDTEEKAYFLGYLFADGNIYTQHRYKNNASITYKLKLSLHVKDLYIVEKFRKCIKSNHPIKLNYGYSKGMRSKDKRMCAINISGEKICKDLIKHGCIERKSLILQFPISVPNHLVHHFIRGNFDGDGCMYFKKKLPSGSKATFLGPKRFLLEIKKRIGILNKKGCSAKIHQRGNIFCLTYSTSSCIKDLREYLYKDASIYLIRKKEKFDETIEALDTYTSKFHSCYGFGKVGGKIVPIPEEQKIILEIKKLRNDGIPYNKIIKIMNKSEMKPRRGLWHHPMIWNICNDRQKNNKIFMAKGELHAGAKLNNEKVLKIRRMYATKKMKNKEIANLFGIHQNHIHRIVTKKAWKHI